MSLVLIAGAAAVILTLYMMGDSNTKMGEAEATAQQEVVQTRPNKKRDKRMEPKPQKQQRDDPYVQGRASMIGGDAANTGEQHEPVHQATVEHEERTPLRVSDATQGFVGAQLEAHHAISKVGGGIRSFFIDLKHDIDKAKESADKQPEFVGVLGKDQHLSDA